MTAHLDPANLLTKERQIIALQTSGVVVMKNQTLLFVTSDAATGTEVEAVLDQARSQNTRVICLILARMPTYPMGAYGGLPYGSIDAPTEWLEDLNNAKQRLAARSEALEALFQKESVSGEVHPVLCVPRDVGKAVARRAMIADIAVVSRLLWEEDTGIYYSAVRGVLFESPIALVLNGSPLARPKRVFLAWDTGLQAARAAHAALPLLKSASEVVIACIDPHAVEDENGEDPGTDLAKWLSHHGCSVTVNQYPSGGKDVGTALQDRARELGADLIVMGAYGRSRMREFIFGGTTRSMLEQTEMPVLLVH